jgi:hypothetical protein
MLDRVTQGEWMGYCQQTSCSSTLLPLMVGGGGNQREAVINGALVAIAKGIACLTLPAVNLIAVPSQEHGERGRSDYSAPFDDRRNWSRFDHLFDEAFFVQRMHRIRLCIVPWVATANTSHMINLTTSWARFKGRLLDWEVVSRLLKNSSLQAEIEQSALHERLKAPVVFATPALYTMPTDYRFRITRGENPACWRLGPLCSYITRSVRTNAFVMAQAGKIVDSLRASHPSITSWQAIHLRAWGFAASCRPRESGIDSILSQVSHALTQQPPNPPTGSLGMYLASEVSEMRMVRERFNKLGVFSAVATKEDVLASLRHDWPFEVCAQIDFEAAHMLTVATNGSYFLTPVSSSDQHIVARRRRLVPPASSICYRGQPCVAHEASCPRGAISVVRTIDQAQTHRVESSHAE